MDYPPLPVDQWGENVTILRDLFQSVMYGWLPAVTPLETVAIQRLDDQTEVRTLVSEALRIDALCIRPTGEPRGTFVGINFHGNHTVISSPNVPTPRGWTYPEQIPIGSQHESWCASEIVQAGFGLVTFCHSDVVPDEPSLAFPVLRGLGGGKPTGAIAAWSWALLSVAETIPGPVFLVGHSRMGKAALLAGAMSDRVGTIAIQSGCGGAAPSRTAVGESVDRITRVFPH